ncbi:EAL domain-containing protein [Saccharibacillus alkalitolerans]|uniref:EAL domain-containing protein n=1 Tax=Saccharibacillus alkalitolerans TaxID=2705290 RepID=A0ABX0F1M1_9BACL|nr:EAL domain-containing protein [Saccharibacillus alkalitolerans]NGZ74791.1 EAL domain-containing protein [Saccharibacillus alkalitolerans]
MKSPLFMPGIIAAWSDLLESVQSSARAYGKSRELHRIVQGRKLSTFFQPILNLQNESCLGYEVLNRPPVSRHFPNTELFYDYIGRTNRVFAFERYCRETSLERFEEARSRIRVPERDPGSVVFINVHPLVLTDSAYRSGETARLLKRYGLPPEQVVFELTEKQAVTDYGEFERVLSHYRDQGFRIAVDDAGSGYSSLKTIVSLKPEFIKLDKSLIRDLHLHEDRRRMVKLLQEFAEGSGTAIIAEGIETSEEAEFLRREGIEYGQGYALGRPDPELKPACFPEEERPVQAESYPVPAAAAEIKPRGRFA